MGCLRIGFAFLVSLFVAAILTVMGVFLGALISFFIASHGAPPQDLSSPLNFIGENIIGVYIGGGIGGTLGLITMASMLRRAADINWLKRYGKRIVATVTEIERKTGTRQVPYTVNNTTQYRTQTYTYYIIMARWVDPRTKQMYTFRSPNLSIYPRRFYEGCGIEVLIDPNNIGKYYMEI